MKFDIGRPVCALLICYAKQNTFPSIFPSMHSCGAVTSHVRSSLSPMASLHVHALALKPTAKKTADHIFSGIHTFAFLACVFWRVIYAVHRRRTFPPDRHY